MDDLCQWFTPTHAAVPQLEDFLDMGKEMVARHLVCKVVHVLDKTVVPGGSAVTVMRTSRYIQSSIPSA